MSVWVDKYRPTNLNEVSGHTDIVNLFRNYIKTKTLPNIIIHGEPGSGKTSSIMALAKELYGEEYFKTEVHELNASDERGICTVRNKIQNLAKKVASSPIGFKLIILDEADFLTKDAQAALRKIMENYSDKTIFCLLCNYIYKIIPPIKSRCSVFYFNPLTMEEIKKQLHKIALQESVAVNDTTMDYIVDTSGGDLRKAIILLQQSHFNENVMDLIGVVPEAIYGIIFTEDSCQKIYDFVDSIYKKGYNISNIIKDIYHSTLQGPIPDDKKEKIIQCIAETDKNINLGCNEYLHFIDLCLNINKIVNTIII